MRQLRRNAHKKILSFYTVALILGLLTGVIGSGFLLGVQYLTGFMKKGMDYTGLHGVSLALLSAIVSMLMIYIAWLMVWWFASEASGSGVQEIEGALLHKRHVYWRRLLPVKFLGGILSISSKLVVGREGPTIQIGGNLGEMLGEFFSLSLRRRDTLITAGAAAGLATAFNAPLAGILFVLEEMRQEFHFSFTSFSAVSISCVMAVIVLHVLIGTQAAISMHVFSLPSLNSLIFFFILGLIAGLIGWLFNITLMKSLAYVAKLRPLMRHLYVLIIGLLVGYFAVMDPAIVGGGYGIIESALTLNPSFLILLWITVARFITTMLSYNVGAPGGFFAPMLALGTVLGLAASHVFQWFITDMSIHPAMFAVAGMGALFAAVVRAPITGIVLVVEMTQNYSLILPLMVACLTSTTVIQLTGNRPIYTQLLNFTLKNKMIAG